jgi:hypothetical protein
VGDPFGQALVSYSAMVEHSTFSLLRVMDKWTSLGKAWCLRWANSSPCVASSCLRCPGPGRRQQHPHTRHHQRTGGAVLLLVLGPQGTVAAADLRLAGAPTGTPETGPAQVLQRYRDGLALAG